MSSPTSPARRTTFPNSIAILALCLTVPVEASAQRESTIGPGSRLRLSGPSLARVTGTLRDTTGGMLRLDVRGDSVAVIPRDAVTNIDVSVGRRSRALPGAAVGLLVGAGIGALIGLAGSDSDDDGLNFGPGMWIAGGAATFWRRARGL